MNYLIKILLCCIPTFAYAQLSRLSVEVQRSDGTTYAFPWVGALNNPQFSEIDIDADGIKDLFIFDKDGNKVLTFKNHGTANSVDYSYQPSWQKLFPDSLTFFVLLRDYNCDGLEDIFSFYENRQTGNSGIMLHKAIRTVDNLVDFELVTKAISFHEIGSMSLSNIFLTIIDLPAIDDIDGDGDLDILAFENGTGYLRWYKNQSLELGYNCDSLIFELKDDCWGRFYESGLGPFPTLSNHVDSCAERANWSPLRGGFHAGTTLLSLDANNDQVKDLILGNVAYNNLNMLYNVGNEDTAFIQTSDKNFPSNDISVDIDFFPAAFFLDVNNDGKKDFIASPNNYNIGTNDEVAWLYSNTGTTTQPDLVFQQADFLVEDMIELGATAAPCLVDFNQDGLIDLVVGNYGIFENNNTYRTRLVAYKNIGTATQPLFKVYDQNFASLQQFNLRRLVPTFGDLDGDQDLDLIIGKENGQLLYLQNIGSPTNPHYASPSPFYASIDVGQYAVPQLVDIDRDNDLDLIIGERNGNINFYQNNGDAINAEFAQTANSETFGFIDARIPGDLEGCAAPYFWEFNGQHYACVGSESGKIRTYQNIDGNLNGTFQPISSDFDQIDEGRQSIPTIGDINNDGLIDIIVGNKRGGLAIFTGAQVTAHENINKDNPITLYPNPTQKGIFLELNNVLSERVSLSLFDVLGQSLKIYTAQQIESPFFLDLSEFATGVYWLKIECANQIQTTHKIVIQK